MMPGQVRFLLVNSSCDQYWRDVLAQALASLGTLQVGVEAEIGCLLGQDAYSVIIIDASAVEDVPPLIRRIRAQQPCARVVVMTASPTWTRAREAFLDGATDYTRKSLDRDEIQAVIRAALDKPLPPCP